MLICQLEVYKPHLDTFINERVQNENHRLELKLKLTLIETLDLTVVLDNHNRTG